MTFKLQKKLQTTAQETNQIMKGIAAMQSLFLLLYKKYAIVFAT